MLLVESVVVVCLQLQLLHNVVLAQKLCQHRTSGTAEFDEVEIESLECSASVNTINLTIAMQYMGVYPLFQIEYQCYSSQSEMVYSDILKPWSSVQPLLITEVIELSTSVGELVSCVARGCFESDIAGFPVLWVHNMTSNCTRAAATTIKSSFTQKVQSTNHLMLTPTQESTVSAMSQTPPSDTTTNSTMPRNTEPHITITVVSSVVSLVFSVFISVAIFLFVLMAFRRKRFAYSTSDLDGNSFLETETNQYKFADIHSVITVCDPITVDDEPPQTTPQYSQHSDIVTTSTSDNDTESIGTVQSLEAITEEVDTSNGTEAEEKSLDCSDQSSTHLSALHFRRELSELRITGSGSSEVSSTSTNTMHPEYLHMEIFV